MPLSIEFEVWEPHITIVPWFPCEDGERLDKVLGEIAKKHEVFIVKAGKVENWGHKEKYRVQKIEDDGPLFDLHSEIFNELESNGFPIHQKDFMDEKYSPHIALRNRLQKGSKLKRGYEILVSEFTLVKQLRLKGSGRMIKTLVKNYELR